MRKLSVWLCALIAAVALSGAAAVAKEWTKVVIATEGAYAPWNFKTADGQLEGFDVELAAELCTRMQVECELVAQDWDGIIPALNAGKYDAIIASLTITDKRREAIDFSDVYADTPRTLLVLKSSPLAQIPVDDKVYSLNRDPDGSQQAIEALKPALQGKVIGVQVNTTGESFLQQYFKDVVEVRAYKTAEQYLLDLAAGRIDAALDNIAYLGGVVRGAEGQNLAMVGPHFNDGVFGAGKAVGLRKSDPELKALFDKALAGAIADGKVRELSLKWFNVDVTPR